MPTCRGPLLLPSPPRAPAEVASDSGQNVPLRGLLMSIITHPSLLHCQALPFSWLLPPALKQSESLLKLKQHKKILTPVSRAFLPLTAKLLIITLTQWGDYLHWPLFNPIFSPLRPGLHPPSHPGCFHQGPNDFWVTNTNVQFSVFTSPGLCATSDIVDCPYPENTHFKIPPPSSSLEPHCPGMKGHT